MPELDTKATRGCIRTLIGTVRRRNTPIARGQRGRAGWQVNSLAAPDAPVLAKGKPSFEGWTLAGYHTIILPSLQGGRGIKDEWA